jgi:ABC-type molybdenum transport system ATPase subunit/photorepair protein PhrA
LALLFTWRDIAKMRNSSSTNLLILDEIFDSSLDGSGTDFFTVIIRYMLQDSNVFVISHKTEELGDKFENILTFEKVNGFSKLSGTL